MIVFTQMTDAGEILDLHDYYVVSLLKDTDRIPGEDILSVSMMHVVDGETVNEAAVPVKADASEDEAAFSEEQVASGVARLLIGNTVLSEPGDLTALRSFLERFGYEGEIRFIPVSRFAYAVFPELMPGPPDKIAEQLNIICPETDELLYPVYLSDGIFR